MINKCLRRDVSVINTLYNSYMLTQNEDRVFQILRSHPEIKVETLDIPGIEIKYHVTSPITSTGHNQTMIDLLLNLKEVVGVEIVNTNVAENFQLISKADCDPRPIEKRGWLHVIEFTCANANLYKVIEARNSGVFDGIQSRGLRGVSRH